MFRCLYNSELITVLSNSDNTAIVSLLSYLNIGNIITLPNTTYGDTNILSASLADKINYYLVNITSVDLNLVTGYTNHYSGTCTLDKTFNELLEAINNKYNIQIYFSPYNSYCKVSTYVKDNSIIELSFILDRAFSQISYIKSTNKITITQYSISDVTNLISDDNINAISSGAVYNLKTDLESKISSIKVGVPTIQAGTGVRSEVFNGNDASSATGDFSHAEGNASRTTGWAAHAEGQSQANGDYSHSEGDTAVANGAASHAEGRGTVATRQSAHVEGDYNVQDGAAIHQVGIGTTTGRKDAHRITYDGKHYIIGIGGFDGTKATANLTNEKDLATVINGYETRIAALERALAATKN